MMRGIRRLVVCAAATGLLAGGAVTASMEIAHADTVVKFCDGTSSDSYACTVTGNISAPGAVTITLSATGTEDVALAWTVSCTDNASATPVETSGGATASLTSTATAPEGLTPLPSTADGTCTVTGNVSLPTSQPAPASGTFTPSNFTAELSYTPAASSNPSPGPSPSPVPSSGPVHPIKGFGGKCVDDKGNSSANRAAIVIWSCSGTDQAENWKFSNGEFIHDGKCMNDQGNGGSGSKVILYTCNGASNEKWAELANGELRLQAHGGTLCLDDPRSSTTNGTQLIVYTCKDSANQKWSLP
jgi:hypothetical protein